MQITASRTYDPKTGTWSASYDIPAQDVPTSSAPAPAKSTAGGDTGSGGGESNLKATSPDKDSSDGKTDKKYNTIEFNTLEGDLSFIVTEQTIMLKAGDTVRLEGLGKYLSGNYFVLSVTRNISRDGYSHSAVVIRTDFGDKLKSGSSTESKGGTTPPQAETTSSSEKASTEPQRTYTVKKGDCLWNIAKSYYGSGQKWKTIYDANTGQIVNPNLIYPGQKLTIP